MVGRDILVFCAPGIGNRFVTEWVHVKHYGLTLMDSSSGEFPGFFLFSKYQENIKIYKYASRNPAALLKTFLISCEMASMI